MNKKLTVKTDDGRVRYCVLAADADEKDQLHEVMGISKGYGLSVSLYADTLCVEDYFHGDTVASMAVLSVEDTALPPSLHWTDI